MVCLNRSSNFNYFVGSNLFLRFLCWILLWSLNISICLIARDLNLHMRHINWHALRILVIKIWFHLNFCIDCVNLYLRLNLYLFNYWLCFCVLFLCLNLDSGLYVSWLLVLCWCIYHFLRNLFALCLCWYHLGFWYSDNLVVSLNKSWSHSYECLRLLL